MKLITLNDEQIVGKGRDRICYRHPTNSDLCIKVSIHKNKQSTREASYFNYLYKSGSDLTHLSCYRGTLETDQGLGYLFDLVLDADGSISKTLTEHLNNGTLSEQEIAEPVQKLRQYLIHNRICVRDISPSNIVYQKLESGFKLVIIDGVSNPGVYPWTIRFQGLVERANNKSWSSFERKVKRLAAKRQQASADDSPAQ